MTEPFDQYRPYLFAIAYRMLGSVMDAEDMVQETFLRWQAADRPEVNSPKAYLATIISRLCIDQLRDPGRTRESYIGPWLPEPLIMAYPPTDDLTDTLSMAFLLLLEQLSPTERAVFLLREVFDYDYGEVAQMVDKSEANCRQMVRRAREHLAAGRPRFRPGREEQERLTLQFVRTCTEGDMEGLLNLLANDITAWSDGGGKVTAARQPIQGAEKVARLILGLMRKIPAGLITRFALVNDDPGFIYYLEGKAILVMALEIGEGRIQNIRSIINPDKLSRIPPLENDEW